MTARTEDSGPEATAWRLAVDAYRTLAANGRAAIVVSVLPAILLLAGSAAISFAALGDPFPEEGDFEGSSAGMPLDLIPSLILYALGTLIVFVSWTRVVLGLQQPALVSFLSQHLKAAPVWLSAWLIMPLAVGLAAFILLVPLVVIFVLAGGAAPTPAADDLPTEAGYVIAIVAFAAIMFATARFVLRASLISADLTESPVAKSVLGSWVRAGAALILATVPLMAVGLVIGEMFRSFDWMLNLIGVAFTLLFALLQGAVCASIIRAGR